MDDNCPQAASTEGEQALPVSAEHGPMEDRVYDAYQAQRGKLLDSEQELGRSFDRYLITLSGGALGLSLTFVANLASPGPIAGVGWLVISWTSLTLTIVLVGAMMRFSQVGHEKFRNILDVECAKGGGEFWKRVRVGQSECWEPRIVGALNWASLGMFVLGIGFLLIFTIVSLSAKSSEFSHEPRSGKRPTVVYQQPTTTTSTARSTTAPH